MYADYSDELNENKITAGTEEQQGVSEVLPCRGKTMLLLH